jgi:hypothetical protein
MRLIWNFGINICPGAQGSEWGALYLGLMGRYIVTKYQEPKKQ